MKLLISALLLVSGTIKAEINYDKGEWGSGGGNAVVCFKKVTEARGDDISIRNFPQEVRDNGHVIPDELIQYIESVELFDLYEAKKRRGLNPKPPRIIPINTNENVFEYVDRVASRFKGYVSYMELIISSTRQMLPQNNFILEDSAVKYQNDLGSVIIPNDHCVISTMAVQVNFNNFYKVHIDGRLFNHKNHSRLSQAVLILHETVYAYARARGQKDSGTTRELVKNYITGGDLITEGDVARALHNLDFGRARDEGWPSELAQIYNESFITDKAYTHFSDFYLAVWSAERKFFDDNRKEFTLYYNEARRAVVKYSINDCDKYLGLTADEIYESLLCVANHTNNQDPEKYLEMIRMIQAKYPMYVQYLNKVMLPSLEQNLVRDITTNTNITADDLSRLQNNFEVYTKSYLLAVESPGDMINFHNDFADNNITTIYEFLFTDICFQRSTQPSGPVIIIEESDDYRGCAKPLKLNNVIPEK